MKNLKNKSVAISIAILLTISMTASIMLIMPTASAHSPPWNIPTYAYIVAAPDPVGVGQPVQIYMWLDPVYGVAGGSSSKQPVNAPLHLGVADKDNRLIDVMKFDTLVGFFF